MDDPMGQAYWSFKFITEKQQDVAAALTPDWQPLRSILQQAKADGNHTKRVSARTNWERLHVMGLLCVDKNRRNGVWVRRGELWDAWWAEWGDYVHRNQSIRTGNASPDEVL
jgi:hypothetical protein